jgi:hypothetical protein
MELESSTKRVRALEQPRMTVARPGPARLAIPEIGVIWDP